MGIDVEPNQLLPADIRGMVTSLLENAHFMHLTTVHLGVAWDRFFFSAKESLYEAWFPLIRM